MRKNESHDEKQAFTYFTHRAISKAKARIQNPAESAKAILSPIILIQLRQEGPLGTIWRSMMRKSSVAMLVLFMVVGYAHGQSRVELFGGYSFLHGAVNTAPDVPVDMHLNGWNASFAAKLMPHVQVVADVGGYYETLQIFACGIVPNHGCGPFSTHIYDTLFGPQVSVSIGKLRPFAHALFGVAHLSTSGALLGSDTAYANALGGGLDYWLTQRVGLRGQADYFPNRFFTGDGFLTPRQNNLRFSTGFVFRP